MKNTYRNAPKFCLGSKTRHGTANVTKWQKAEFFNMNPIK